MDTVVLSRALFGSSMAFHIIFATLGVGIPVMILFAEIMYQITKDAHYALMAKRWTRGFAILLGVGIPSGTIVGVMLSLLFPGFMQIVGQVIALPFQIEIWAFFIEALFMSIYVYAADRLAPSLRITSLVFVAFGAVASAVLITDAQAWMNTPRGFRMVDGVITDVHPWDAFFNPNFPTSATHVAVSALMTGAFCIAAVAAYKLLRGERSEQERSYHRKSLLISLVLGGVMSLMTALNGHATAQHLHRYTPEKLAAAEGLFETTKRASLTFGGIPDPDTGKIKWGIEIPYALSILAANRIDTEVKGLNDYPRDDWPPLYSHTLFDLMVLIGMVLIVVAFYTVWRFYRRKPLSRWLLWVVTLCGPLSMIGIETGWIFSCSSRQPWTIYHVQRTSEAATKTADVGLLFFVFIAIYLFLLIVTAIIMHQYFKRHPVAAEWADARR